MIKNECIIVYGKTCICDEEDVVFENQCTIYKLDKCLTCNPLDCSIDDVQ